ADSHSNRRDSFDSSGADVDDVQLGDPVRMSDGAFQEHKTDLFLGSGEPRGISFARSYSSSRRFNNPAGMSAGWRHNYHFGLFEGSDADTALGGGTPAQMASMLVAARAAFELYRTNLEPRNWLLTVLIAKWGGDQLINNSV